jgi:hypothetical protein
MIYNYNLVMGNLEYNNNKFLYKFRFISYKFTNYWLTIIMSQFI